MKRNAFLLVVTAVMLALSSFALLAQDDQGNVNDPTTNDRANACYDDGSMAGKCNDDGNGDGVITQAEIDLQWTCGWYVIRVEYGIYGRDAIPSACIVFLGAEPVFEEESVAEDDDNSVVNPPAINCQQINNGQYYVDFGSSNVLPQGSPTYLSSDCTGTAYNSGSFSTFVYTTSGQGDAANLCDFATNGAQTDAGVFSGNPNVYYCETK